MSVQSKTISVYVSGRVAEALDLAIERAGLRASQWGSRAFLEKLERDGMLPEQISNEDQALAEAKAAIEIVGADVVLEVLKRAREGTYAREEV
jgi:hypothetical protein